METTIERHEHPEGFAELGTIRHEGRSCTASGAYVDDLRIVAYLGPCERDLRELVYLGHTHGIGCGSRQAFAGDLHAWDGTKIGRYTLTGTWRQHAPGAYTATRVYQVYMVLTDGRAYHGRSQGPGMIVQGRRAAQAVSKPIVRVQDKVVVSRCGECAPCQEWLLAAATAPRCAALLVLWPDGEITHEGTAATALRAIRRRLRIAADPAAINVAQVEWRDGTAP